MFLIILMLLLSPIPKIEKCLCLYKIKKKIKVNLK